MGWGRVTTNQEGVNPAVVPLEAAKRAKVSEDGGHRAGHAGDSLEKYDAPEPVGLALHRFN